MTGDKQLSMIGLFKTGQNCIDSSSPLVSRKSKNAMTKAIRIHRKKNSSFDKKIFSGQYHTLANSAVKHGLDIDGPENDDLSLNSNCVNIKRKLKGDPSDPVTLNGHSQELFSEI